MSKRAKDPPLEEVVGRSYSEDGPLTVTRRRRGFLTDVHVSDDTRKKRWPKRFRSEGTEALTALSNRLRTKLDAADLPTDKWPVMPRELDYGYVPEQHGIVADEDIWIEIVEDSTEPLTELRVAADLLHALNPLLARFTEDQLRDVYRAMTLYHLHRVIEELHEPALSGTASIMDRAKGPAAKKERSEVLRKLILRMAEELWKHHSRLRGQTFNTAKKIGDAVNEARAVQNLGRKPLAINTIANHLRVALSEPKRE